jgi:hypothetical protein
MRIERARNDGNEGEHEHESTRVDILPDEHETS